MHSFVLDFGYPWGTVAVPRRHEVYEFYASCEAEDHLAHPYCHPGWQERVANLAGQVLVGPVYDVGWYILVAVPEGTHVPSGWGVPVVGTPVPAVRVDLFYPRGGWTTVRLYSSAREAEEWAVRVLQPAGPARAYRVRRLDRRTRKMMAEGLFKPLEPGVGVWVYHLDA